MVKIQTLNKQKPEFIAIHYRHTKKKKNNVQYAIVVNHFIDKKDRAH